LAGNRNIKKGNQIKGIGRGGSFFIKAFFALPLINRWHPWLKEDKSDMRWLPINEDIRMQDNVPMPVELLDRFISEASHRVIFDDCGCRRSFRCKHYPVDIGCLLMGDSALESKRNWRFREVGVDEAREHVRRAVEAGLVPVVGKARVDNFIFGIKDRSRMLTVCFCCECCCVTRFTTFVPARYLEPVQPWLESVSIEFTDRCRGCGKCVECCYIGAIEVIEGKAVRSDICRACGRCAAVCPQKSIEIEISDPDFIEKTRDRIRSYVTYD